MTEQVNIFRSHGMMMEQFEEITGNREIIKGKLRQCFDGRIVRKDLTKHIDDAGKILKIKLIEHLIVGIRPDGARRKRRRHERRVDIWNATGVCERLVRAWDRIRRS